MSDLVKISTGDDEHFLLKLISDKFTQAGISLIPYAGGPIQTILSATIQERKERKWYEYWQTVESRLTELGRENINRDYFGTEDFIKRLVLIYEEVVNRSDEAKLKYLRDYFLSCAWKMSPDVTWKDLFLQYLTRLSGAHLGVLQEYYVKQGHLSIIDRFSLPQRTNGLAPLTVLDISQIASTLDIPLIEILISDLSAMGLLHPWLGQPPEPKAWSISESGIRFMKFLDHSWTVSKS